jgi:hypothetical protein
MPIQYPELNIEFNASKMTFGLRSQHYQLLTLSSGQDYDRSVATPVLYLPKPIQGCPIIIRNVDGTIRQDYWVDIKRYDRKDINGTESYIRFFTSYGYMELWPYGDQWVMKGLPQCAYSLVEGNYGYQFLTTSNAVAQSIAADTWVDVTWAAQAVGPTVQSWNSTIAPEWNDSTGVLTPSNNFGIPRNSLFRIYGALSFANPGSPDVTFEVRAVSPSGTVQYGGWSTVSDGSTAIALDKSTVIHSDISHKWQVKHNHSGAVNLTNAAVFYYGLGW